MNRHPLCHNYRMQIRPDFKEAEPQLQQFVVFADAFQRFNFQEWPALKNNSDFELVYRLDFAASNQLQAIYADGRDVAVNMSSKLLAFNWPTEFVTLKSYVDSFKPDSWVYDTARLSKQVADAENTARSLGSKAPSIMGQMFALFRKQIEMLDAVRGTLGMLKTSKLYQHGFTPTASAGAAPWMQALKAIHATGKNFERLPATYQGKDEESLRDHLILTLSNHPGSVSGETYNKRGKTDILYSLDGVTELVVECKIWRGEKQLLQAVDQLLSYLTWRDTRAALVLFVPNKDFTAVVESIGTYLKAHTEFHAQLADEEKTWMKFEFKLPGDPQRLITTAVMLYHIPR
jgi:hypothetical protein